MSWLKEKLGKVLTIERGGSPRPIDKYLTNSPEGVNWIKISDATASDKYIFETKEKIKKEGLHKTRMVNEGDFILSNSMSFGRPYIMKTTGCIHDGWLVLKQNGEKVFDTEFLYYLLSSPYVFNQFNYLAAGSTVRNLNIALVSSVEVPIPPLPEQQRIVALLDEAFAAITKAKANAEQNLKNAKELFGSYLQGVFENKGEGWEEKTLAQISKTFGRGKSKHRPRNWNGLYGGNYPFIQTGDIRNCNHYITEYSQTYNDVGLAQSKLWKAGTICITIAANIAETGVLTFDACFPDSVIGIEVNEIYADRDFVEYLLQSFKVRIQALGKGSAQANINLGTFENELFPFPTVAQQKSIVEKLNQLSAESNKLEATYLKKLADLEELKKSILQKAFAGELTDKSISS